MRISRFANSVTPYVAGEQPRGMKLIKLNTNENPYPPASECKRALDSFDMDSLKLYPSITASELKEAIAAHEGVKAENIFVGNGSDEVLSLAFRTLFDPHADPVKFPEITYSFYPVFCAMYGIVSENVPMAKDYTVDVKKLTGGQGAVIANPNAPTSLSLPLNDIEWLVASYGDKPVIVDEAYIDFATRTQSAVGLTEKYDNIVVIKTFSKSYSLAGIRCGYMVAREDAVKALERVRDCFNSYPVDSVCQAVCTAAVKAEGYHRECVDKVIATRERIKSELKAAGRQALDSDTNFLFVRGGKEDYIKLKESGILVRWFSGEKVREFTRVSIGSDEEMDAYMSALLKR